MASFELALAQSGLDCLKRGVDVVANIKPRHSVVTLLWVAWNLCYDDSTAAARYSVEISGAVDRTKEWHDVFVCFACSATVVAVRFEFRNAMCFIAIKATGNCDVNELTSEDYSRAVAWDVFCAASALPC